MSEWFENQKQARSNLHELLQQKIEKANPRGKLTTEEGKRLKAIRGQAEKTYL